MKTPSNNCMKTPSNRQLACITDCSQCRLIRTQLIRTSSQLPIVVL